MDSARRRYYLEALDLAVWPARFRDDAARAAPVLAEDPPPVIAAEVTGAPAVTAVVASPVAQLNWDELASTVRDCRLCRLRAGCKQTVFGVGARTAPLLVIGEAPGADEDRLGEPFVGRAGKLLDAMLAAIGRDRKSADGAHSVYIANVVKCRPPENRDPQPDEAAACRAYLERQIALQKPKAILAVGRIAAQNLLATEESIGKLRGRRFSYGERNIPVIVTYHPAYLLRSPREKSKAWLDLKQVRGLLS